MTDPSNNNNNSSNRLLLNDKDRFFPPQPDFVFGETKSDDDENTLSSTVTFFCELPPHYHIQQRLTFGCREKSVGVLLQNEVNTKQDEQNDNTALVDPFFFDAQYTLAGRTGFQVWAGSRILIEYLLGNERISCDHHQRISHTILELGAGVGLVGTCLAAACGANVLLTDLPTLVKNAIIPNLKRNAAIKNEEESTCSSPPTWLQQQQSESSSVRIGNGWASATALDWTVPINYQLQQNIHTNIDMIVSSDCVWLQSMLHPLLQTVASIFEQNEDCVFLMSFQKRDSKNSSSSSDTMFTTKESITQAVRARGWSMECVAWRTTIVEGEPEEKEVFVFEILPGSS